MAGPQAGARLWCPALEPVGGAGVQDLISGPQGCADGLKIRDQLRMQARPEGRGFDGSDRTCFD
jgi:hypothetical protein